MLAMVEGRLEIVDRVAVGRPIGEIYVGTVRTLFGGWVDLPNRFLLDKSLFTSAIVELCVIV